MLRSTLATEHELLNAQLQELAGLRQELQGLYEKTQAELQVTKSEAALERGLREAATADNVALRKWNAQLGEELSALLGHLQEEEDEVAADSRRGGRFNEEEEAMEEAAAASAAATAAGSLGAGWSPSARGGEGEGALSRANNEVVARLVRLRQSGSQHEQQVSQRLLARLVGSGEPLLQHEVERLTRQHELAARTGGHGGGLGLGSPRSSPQPLAAASPVRAVGESPGGAPPAELAAVHSRLELALPPSLAAPYPPLLPRTAPCTLTAPSPPPRRSSSWSWSSPRPPCAAQALWRGCGGRSRTCSRPWRGGSSCRPRGPSCMEIWSRHAWARAWARAWAWAWAWCMVPCEWAWAWAWCMVHGAWCMGHGAWCMGHGAWCMGHGAWCRRCTGSGGG